MSRNLYLIGIVCYTIMALISCFWITVYGLRGDYFFRSPSYYSWMRLELVIIVIAEFTLFKYFHYKKYMVAFWINAASLIAFLVSYTVEFSFFIDAVGTDNLVNTTAAINVVVAIGFFFSLIFSSASANSLLKKLGYTGATIGILILVTHMMAITASDEKIVKLLLELNAWFNMVGSLLVLFYILIFYQERKAMKGQYWR